MKKIIILVLMIVTLFPVNVQAAQARTIQTTRYGSMKVKTIKIGKRYRADVYWRSEKIASYKFNRKPKVKFIKFDRLNFDMLASRKNTLYIEITTGKQINAKGDGKVDTDDWHNYISYKRCGFKKGDRIRTYCIFNPYTQWEDDIIERYDEKIR